MENGLVPLLGERWSVCSILPQETKEIMGKDKLREELELDVDCNVD